MQKLHFEITINAPKEKVYSAMLEDKSYREWTSIFQEGSQYTGSWEKGSKIIFGDGTGTGMVAMIEENKPNEFISIKHVGFLSNGVEDTESPEIKAWAPAFENYTFKDINGVTELLIDTDSEDKYADMFRETWPKALEKLKEICERA